MTLQFREIEHKFLVPPDFRKDEFLSAARGLQPLRETAVHVRDTYFVVPKNPGFIYRYRLDEELQQLTVKSFEDPANRLEVNLDLDMKPGSQKDRVFAFMETFGVAWSGTIEKRVNVCVFKNCEVVYYSATYRERKIHCVEFEAENCETLAEAAGVLKNYETKLGFDQRQREKRSLFELLVFPEHEELKQYLAKEKKSEFT